ncbi:UPF0057-domain-containing protein [Gonapodya prolifera JEL478]|uniref:UPF0057-domain-containing protein n=1 Tax=Gonapodya prolifera (strain JEL478) TaxID=1344416 RepID=A0A139AG14_GONPJ|nr:UPF0057-domain-containing protein [Gonapodya prolifera JEL478]|eukprot:KXS15504.1 UPF0057-domain-containing protein [Gonapodya prolifera JEL478]
MSALLVPLPRRCTKEAAEDTEPTPPRRSFEVSDAIFTPISNTMPVTGGDILKIFFAILLPPLGVFLEVGLETPFWINILLTVLGFIPGIIHACYIIFTR